MNPPYPRDQLNVAVVLDALASTSFVPRVEPLLPDTGDQAR